MENDLLICVIFLFVHNRLYCRDPHQLFELLCIQLKAIAIAYSEGLKKLIKPSDVTGGTKYNAIELLNCKWIEIETDWNK